MIVKLLGYIEIEDLKNLAKLFIHLHIDVFGRVVAADIKDPVTGELLLKQGHIIGRDDIDKIS